MLFIPLQIDLVAEAFAFCIEDEVAEQVAVLVGASVLEVLDHGLRFGTEIGALDRWKVG